MFKKLKLAIAVAILFCSQEAYANQEKFLSFSDIHFNPFASCTLIAFKPCPQAIELQKAPVSQWQAILEQYDGKAIIGYGHDTNYALLKVSLAEIKKVSQTDHPYFALLLGDFLAHSFRAQYILNTHDHSKSGYEAFVAKTVIFLTQEIKQTLPNISVFPAVGNNDSYTGDYSVVPQGKFLQDTGSTWATLIKNKNNQESFLRDFHQAGFYSVKVGANNIIVLDTVLFSHRAKTPEKKAAALKQLTWLDRQLSIATRQNQKVLLAFHIPVGADFPRSMHIFFSKTQEFWLPEYKQRLRQILLKFPLTVTAMLVGHVHRDTIHVLGINMPNAVPVSLTPSISPIFGNNPGFNVYSFDVKTFKLGNVDEYTLPLDRSSAEWEKKS